ncbi:MAG TPA: Rrf2 family transcriptional regulator [Candidatus Acidoferrales bacterium]|nr:Rrf2 family transcriptional regulator [Candidatus Acidoferrales bacterium]
MGLMQISRKADYALRAAIYLARQDPERSCSAAEIALRQQVPQKFLEKIIRDLIRGGLVKSKRGWNGGYALARPSSMISFRDVIEAVEGPIAVNLCLQPERCCEHLSQCRMIGVWSEVQRRVLEVFTRTTLADLQPETSAASNSSSLSSAA